ncbi:MAG: sugar phosphate isomerase/epimerase [Planctomycetota bacterium]
MAERFERIGVDVEDFRLPVKDGLRMAAELSFGSVELAAVSGELAPSNLSSSARRHVARLVAGLGLRLSALRADIPGTRLTDPKTVQERVERTWEIIELAADLGVRVVTSAVGAMTHPDSGEPSAPACEALRRIGEVADARGVSFAIRPSYDDGERIARVLEELGCPAIGVGLDPAAMVMAGTNPLKFIERYAADVLLLHARDATAGFPDRPGHETRLGEGDVDLVGLLAVLEAAEYAGPYVIRRSETPTPVQDIVAAGKLLRQQRM